MKQLLLSAFLALTPLIALGQADTTAAAPAPDTLIVRMGPGIPVVFNNDTLWSVYSPLGEFNDQERVNQIVQRLRMLARNKANLNQLTLVETEGVTDVLLDTLRVFSVTSADARAVGRERAELADEYRSIVIEKVTERRGELSLKQILINVGLILLAVGLTLAALWILRWLFPKLYTKIEGWEGGIIPAIRIRGWEIISASSLASANLVALKGIRLALSLAVLYFFITYVLAVIPWTQTWNPAPLLQGLIFTILLTALAVVVFRGGGGFFRNISGRIDAWKGTLIRPVKIKTVEVLSEDRIAEILKGSVRITQFAAAVFAVYLYVTLVFSFFPFSQTWAATLFGYVVDPLKNVALAVVNYLPNLFFIAVIVFVTRFLIKVIHLVFSEVGRGTIAFPGFHKEWAEPTYKIVRFLVIAFAAIIIFPYLPGSDSPAFQGVSVFLGILFSLGSTSAIANIVAGVVLTYMRPFRVGDRVKIADTIGDVVEKTLLVTRVRTVKNVDITIPNSMVLGSHIINYSSSAHEPGLILHTGVTIGYDVPWKTVHELLIASAEATENILKDPKPFVLQTSLDDFYVSYELNAFTNSPAMMSRIYSDLHQHIQDKFNEAGVEIMSPHYSAMRDGNQSTIPQDYLPKSYQAPSFRIIPGIELPKTTPRSDDKGSSPKE